LRYMKTGVLNFARIIQLNRDFQCPSMQ
jgi:hypothetical protein